MTNAKVSRPKAKKNGNQSATYIGIFFLVSSAMFGFFIMNEEHLNIPEEGQSDFSSLHKPDDLNNINEHLRSVTDKIELARLKNQVANLKAGRAGGTAGSNSFETSTNEPIIEFDNDPRMRRLADELGRTNQVQKIGNDPRTQAYEAVIQKRKDDQKKAEENRLNAERFVAEALKDGWVVKLDSNYGIKSYYQLQENPNRQKETEYKGFTVVPK